MSGYALNMLMKRDLCATISNPSDYAIVRENGRSNCAPKVTAQLPNGEADTTPRQRRTPREKGTSWMVAATPTNPTTIKISRDKHDPREDHNSLLYRTVAEIVFAGHINYLPHCFSQRNVSPVATHVHMCQSFLSSLPNNKARIESLGSPSRRFYRKVYVFFGIQRVVPF